MLGRSDEQETFSAYSPYVQDLHGKLRNSYTLTQKKLLSTHEQHKKAYDKKSTESSFRVGDRVWLFVPAVTT